MKEWLFRCPVCQKPLIGEKVAKCEQGHCFDVAKQGHINLLMSNAKGKRHGDDSAMVQARSAFLDKGYYAPLRDKIKEIVKESYENYSTVQIDCTDQVHLCKKSTL